MKRPAFLTGPVILAAILAAGFVLGFAVRPLVAQIRAYYDTSNYRAITEYELPAVPTGGVANFALIDSNGVGHELYRERRSRAVVIIAQGTGCTGFEKYSRLIRPLTSEYESRGIRFMMLNVDSETTRERVNEIAFGYHVELPILMDPERIVTSQLGFKSVGEAILIDTKTWKVIYRGPVAGKVAEGKKLPDEVPLQAAIENFLHAQPIAQVEMPMSHCPIAADDRSPKLYAKDIARVIAHKCMNCHSSAAGMKPFLDSYQQVASWAAMIKDSVFSKRMPPWGIDSVAGQFEHDLGLEPEQVKTLVDWIDAGAPRGPGPDPLMKRAAFLASAPMRDQAFRVAYEASTAEDVVVPPKGFTEYQYYQLGGQVPRDIWIDGINVKSTNPGTLHHQMLIISSTPLSKIQANVMARVDDELKANDALGSYPIWTLAEIYRCNAGNEQFSRLQVWALGRSQPMMYSNAWPGAGYLVPKGSYLILETHYHGNGREERERTTVQFSETPTGKPLHPIRSDRMSAKNFIEVPPFASNHVVTTDPLTIEKKSTLLLNSVHMHMRGKSMKVIAKYPNKKTETLFSMPFFNYNTSTAIAILFRQPKVVPPGTKIYAECIYDNTDANPFNPDPSKLVPWGQTLDRSEMCLTQTWYYEVP